MRLDDLLENGPLSAPLAIKLDWQGRKRGSSPDGRRSLPLPVSSFFLGLRENVWAKVAHF
jgi:hypothetical protein